MDMLSCAFQWSNGIEWILGTYIINMGESQKKGAEWQKKIEKNGVVLYLYKIWMCTKTLVFRNIYKYVPL